MRERIWYSHQAQAAGGRMVMSLALSYAHMPSIFAFMTLPIEPNCTTATAMWCNLPCDPHNLVWPTLTSAHIQHCYRHSIILVIGYRHSTQAPHFTAPFTPHMTLLGFMCPALGKFIRSWVLSHHAINKLYDMSPLSHSPSLDQLPLLCTPLVFATY